jgi:outer membrane protein assembly factor BamD
LREVQEVLAQRQYEIGQFYVSKENWAGGIARLQTVADTYPLFSHSDLTLIALGDAYETEAQAVSRLNLQPKAKAQLLRIYNDRAAAAWERVVVHDPMAPHVEDAKDRLIALGRDVPEPTQQELAESEAEEGSRINVRLKDRAMLLVKHGPSTIEAARVGEPSLTDPTPTYAPDLNRQSMDLYKAALENKPLPGVTANGQDETATAISQGAAPPAAQQPAVTAAPLQFETVPDQGGSAGSTVTVEVPSGGGSASSAGSGSDAGASGGNAAGSDAGASIVAKPTPGGPVIPSGNTTSVPGPNANEPVVKAVGPVANAPLPAVDKPAEAPNQINDVKGGGAQVNTSATASGKKSKKAPYDSKDESSSKHKKKKGLDKLNPF